MTTVWESCDGLWFAEARPIPADGWWPPFVSLDFKDDAATLTVDDARAFAAHIVATADVAEALGAVTSKARNPAVSAVEKSVALVNSISGPMDQTCPVCRGGWWYDQGEIVYAVHAAECPWKDAGERDIHRAANSHSETAG